MMKIIFSNRWEILADTLCERLLTAPAFAKRYLLVPSSQMREFLLFHLAKTLGVAAGVTIVSLERGVSDLISSKKRIPSFLELILSIEAKLRSLPQEALYAPLADYIKGEKEERILVLSEELARHFMRYGIYGRPFLSEWLKKRGWQQELWRALFSEECGFSYPIEVLKDKKIDGSQVHLFGFPALADPYLHFFAESGAHFYHFSPCAEYWDDLCSDREKLAIDKRLCAKGASRLVREEMQHYLEARHPLLANWGKLGREWIKRLDAYELDTDSYYKTPKEGTLLSALKKSLLEMQEVEVVEEKHSIQLHSAPSKLREVEVMQALLFSVFDQQKKRGEPLAFSDILIFAPDISAYAPYIHTLFTASGIPHAIEGLKVGALSPVTQGFFHLLSLAEAELSLQGMLRLLSFESFRKRFGFCWEDVETIEEWLKSAQVRSGKASFDEGLDRLLFGLAMLPEDDHPFPLPCIKQTQMQLFSAFCVCLQSVQRSIDEMHRGGHRSLSEWLEWARTLLLSHFVCEEEEPLLYEMQTVGDVPGLFPFTSLKRLLHHFYDKQSGKLTSPHLDKINCASIKSGVARSARVIYLLGMDEESFPRQEMISSLCAMPRSMLTKADEDRYLFLELLVSAEEYFLLSYERNGDFSSKGPCSLILELMRYLKEGALIKNHSPNSNLLSDCNDISRDIEKREFFSWEKLSFEESTIFLRDLKQMARHPLRCYFNKRHGIYLEREEEVDGAFYLSSLQRYMLKERSLSHSLKHATHYARERGLFPEGLFKDVAIDLLNEEVEEEMRSLELLGVKGSDLFSIELSPYCSTAMRLKEGGWVVPALKIADVQIVGTLSRITPRGLLVQAKKDVEGVIAIWPLYLIFLHVKEQCEEIEGGLLFAKSGKSMMLEQDPRPLLEEYIEYYKHALEKPSPLMPKWAKCLVQGEKELFCARVEKTFDEELFYPDPYLEWMQSSGIAIEAADWYERWMPYIEKCFSKVVQWTLTS